MCNYIPINNDIKANNYQVNEEMVNYISPEDVLLWYTKVQDKEISIVEDCSY